MCPAGVESPTFARMRPLHRKTDENLRLLLSTLRKIRRRGNSEPSPDAACGHDPRLAAGIYTWMPLGLRVVRRVEAIVRERGGRRAGSAHARGAAGRALGEADAGSCTARSCCASTIDTLVNSASALPTKVITDLVRREVKPQAAAPQPVSDPDQVQGRIRRFGVCGRENSS